MDPMMLYVHVCQHVLAMDGCGRDIQSAAVASNEATPEASNETAKSSVWRLLPVLRRLLACCACGSLLTRPIKVGGSEHICCGSCWDSKPCPFSLACPCLGGVRKLGIGSSLDLAVECYRQMCSILKCQICIHTETCTAKLTLDSSDSGDQLIEKLLKEATTGGIGLSFDDLPIITKESLPNLSPPLPDTVPVMAVEPQKRVRSRDRSDRDQSRKRRDRRRTSRRSRKTPRRVPSRGGKSSERMLNSLESVEDQNDEEHVDVVSLSKDDEFEEVDIMSVGSAGERLSDIAEMGENPSSLGDGFALETSSAGACCSSDLELCSSPPEGDQKESSSSLNAGRFSRPGIFTHLWQAEKNGRATHEQEQKSSQEQTSNASPSNGVTTNYNLNNCDAEEIKIATVEVLSTAETRQSLHLSALAARSESPSCWPV